MPPKKIKKQTKAAVRVGGDDDDHISVQQDDDSQLVVAAAAAAPPPPIPSEPTTPISKSYTYASPIPSECSRVDPSNPAIRVPCVLGVDEAGRGPVLGPLVYGIAYCPVSYQDDLKQIGFADSKALTAERRDTLLSALIDDSTHLGWAVRVMAPQDISAGMLRRRPVNLNAQSSAATVSLIAGVLESGVDVTEIYVDTVGDPKSYSRLLSSQFPRHPHIKWTVTSKADAIYPIVGAASIAAKVTRDRCIEGWRYAEQQQPSRTEAQVEKANVLGDTTNHPPPFESSETKKRKAETGEEVDGSDVVNRVWDNLGALGSGYPGDPNTVAFLKRTLDPVFGWPGIVRFSWATAKTMLEEKVKLPSSSSTTTTISPVNNTATTLGGKRLTRSLSRTSSFTDAAAASASSTPTLLDSNTTAPPTSLYGTLLPQASVAGGTAPRGYKVKWIDEPVSISKFFGAKKASSAISSLPAAGTDVFQPSALQLAINDWLKQESQSSAKPASAAQANQIQLNVLKLTKDLGIASANALFTL
ncbi:hypothetical protein EX895_003607 [Sporisorium graminicola]|uniref:Ribonuclease n=1 Tax=Sporisorium graminicola TaxID=280036 RepID=A0A4U7KT30_9BASI|nr:hypothetical protein EX895_003607 [Sporisorium graminicola]TKY87593.1 hypothetical protein EX895_003607 [Sporisorium graminicola]